MKVRAYCTWRLYFSVIFAAPLWREQKHGARAFIRQTLQARASSLIGLPLITRSPEKSGQKENMLGFELRVFIPEVFKFSERLLGAMQACCSSGVISASGQAFGLIWIVVISAKIPRLLTSAFQRQSSTHTYTHTHLHTLSHTRRFMWTGKVGLFFTPVPPLSLWRWWFTHNRHQFTKDSTHDRKKKSRACNFLESQKKFHCLQKKTTFSSSYWLPHSLKSECLCELALNAKSFRFFFTETLFIVIPPLGCMHKYKLWCTLSDCVFVPELIRNTRS